MVRWLVHMHLAKRLHMSVTCFACTDRTNLLFLLCIFYVATVLKCVFKLNLRCRFLQSVNQHTKSPNISKGLRYESIQQVFQMSEMNTHK